MRSDQLDPNASDPSRVSDRAIPRATESPADETRQDTDAPAGRPEQIEEHYQYRETVQAINLVAEARSPWDDALPELRAAWQEHKERYPDQARAVPRNEPDGSWVCGEHRRLDPEQNTEVGKAHADLADEAARHILPALRRGGTVDPGRQLAGL